MLMVKKNVVLKSPVVIHTQAYCPIQDSRCGDSCQAKDPDLSPGTDELTDPEWA